MEMVLDPCQEISGSWMAIPSNTIRGYRDLNVWRDSMDLVVVIYRLTAAIPKEERYSLVNQLRRAAVSVPSNIAEGQARSRTGDYLRHLSIAVGSLSELETHIEIARRLEYISQDDEQRLLNSCTAIGKMLSGLIRSLRRRAAMRSQESGAGSQRFSPDS